MQAPLKYMSGKEISLDCNFIREEIHVYVYDTFL